MWLAHRHAGRRAKPDDILVVYLAGHGVALPRGSELYCYLTKAARSTDGAAFADLAVLAQWAVTSNELVDSIKQIPALKQVLLDTCAAGAEVAASAGLEQTREFSGFWARSL